MLYIVVVLLGAVLLAHCFLHHDILVFHVQVPFMSHISLISKFRGSDKSSFNIVTVTYR